MTIETVYNILAALACFVFGYLIGSVQHGIIIGKLFFHKDPRDYGSHNSGGTNSGRVFGAKIGALVVFLDMMKVIIVFWCCWLVLRFSGIQNYFEIWDGGSFYVYLAPLGAAIGHCWPVYNQFKGGKSVACFMGMNASVSWLIFIFGAIEFPTIFFHKKIMSITSIISSILLTIIQWILAIIFMITKWQGVEILTWTFGMGMMPSFHYFGWEAATICTIIMVILIIRHAANIKRLKNGTEKPLIK